jgi:hypothetical protein
MIVKPIWLVLATLLVGTVFVTGAVKYMNRGDELEGSQNLVKQTQLEVIELKQKVTDKEKAIEDFRNKISALQKVADSKSPCARIDGITAILDEGEFIWHDFYFYNRSDKDLHEVKITVSVTGETGRQQSKSVYFAVWPSGQRQLVQFPVNDATRNVQKYSLTGSCNEGNVDSYWLPKSGK